MKRLLCLFFLASLILPRGLLQAETSLKPATDHGTQTVSKLDQILKDQQEILKQLSEIKAEMQILKMRISSR